MHPGSANTMMRPSPDIYFFLRRILAALFLSATTLFSFAQPVNGMRKLSFTEATRLNITLGYFSQKDIPDSLNGCSESYAFDTLSFRIHKMVLYADAGSTLMLKINYQLLFFHIDKRTLQNKKEITEFSGHGYTGKLISQEVKKTGDELSVYSATIEINRNGKKMTASLLGYVGC